MYMYFHILYIHVIIFTQTEKCLGKMYRLSAVRKGCVRVSFVVWGVVGRLVPLSQMNLPMNEYLNQFVAAHTTRASVALGELTLEMQN